MSEQRLQDDDDLFYRPAARAKQATVEYSTGELRERLALTKAIRANLKEIDAYRNWVSIRTLAAAAGMPIAQPQREETDADGTVGSPGRSGD
jgi:hypothetical protein